jgi:TfoX/Sxy family transcriptional regulator of competence genes
VFEGEAAGASVLPEEARNRLLAERGAKRLRYFPEGPIKKEYVVLPQAMLEDKRTLRRWVKASIEYVSSLPKAAHAPRPRLATRSRR